MLKVFLLCVVAILRPAEHWDTSHIRLFCLAQIQGQRERRGGVKVLKNGGFSYLLVVVISLQETLNQFSVVLNAAKSTVYF